MSEKCPICERIFPDCTESICHLDIVTNAFIDGKWKKMCPLCYAGDFKRVHGIDWEPTGELASQMYEEAKLVYPLVT